jgi:NAD(P)-dependent dehydrogenase (short-subunit alcohol dehydrogenase family)
VSETEATAAIIGANGAIGSALRTALEEEGRFTNVVGLARTPARTDDIALDMLDDASIAQAAARLVSHPPLRLVIVATGILHSGGEGPEKSYRALERNWLMQVMATNAIAPALLAKALLPLMPRQGRTVFATLGARVGSITDNRLGGWYGYRASKAALAMLTQTLAIEQARLNPSSIVCALHPGTVDSALSKPFQSNVAPGKLFTPERAALQLLDVIDGLKPPDSGGHFAWDGERIPA